MKKLNNKGYAITVIIFGILIVFIIVLSTLLITMNNSVKLNKTVKEDVIENIELNADTTGKSLTERIEAVESKLENVDGDIINTIYPVGSVYISTTDDTIAKVKEKFKGTEWEVYAQGRTLVGVGSTTDSNGNVLVYENNKTGGSSLTALNASNLPSHSHSIPALGGTAASAGSGYTLNHTCENRTTSSAGEHDHVTYAFGFEGETGSTPVYGISWGYYGARAVPTASAGAHTHTYPDCYLSSLGGVAPHTHSVTTTANNTGAAGSSTSFSVQDPYITVYMYKRIR